MSDDRYAILAESGLLDARTLVLMCDDTFLVSDRQANLADHAASPHGLYHRGTRHLSALALRVHGRRPLLLSAGVRDDDGSIFVHETNPDLRAGEAILLPRDVVHLARSVRLGAGFMEWEIEAVSYQPAPTLLRLDLGFGADFADVFEVRGARRPRRGEPLGPLVVGGEIVLRHRGLDGRLRTTRVRPGGDADWELHPFSVRCDWVLEPGRPRGVRLRVACEEEGESVAVAGLPAREPGGVSLQSSSGSFDAWVQRSHADLRMLTARTPDGPYPYAGVPWFATPFGRDGLWSALLTLWCDPAMARGVLLFLARHQAHAHDPVADAEPGKILHEMRHGDMAACREIPFGCYYGSVDATPLFVMLAAAYDERCADDATLQRVWPHLERALAWIDGPGDADGDGFVEYRRRTPAGLVNQGWKDSHDSVFHADGRLAEGPIALCEVQAYVYAARVGLARLARRMGDDALAERLLAAAAALRAAFARAFWCEELETYALALDGEGRACRVAASNAAHALYCGIATEEHAARVAARLASGDFFSGWGVRTLATSAPRYNPMSYHNGSIWPHDNAILALGVARYGHAELARRVFASLFDASRAFPHARLPELFCGFARVEGEGPTRYPVACSPQAWSSAALFGLIQASLGLRIDAGRSEVRLQMPRLPSFLRSLEIRDLAIGDARIDLRFNEDGHPFVMRRDGRVDVVLTGAD